MHLAEAFEKLDQLYESTEKYRVNDRWLYREEIIAELKALGYGYYNFKKRPSDQLAKILEKNIYEHEKEKAFAEVARMKTKSNLTCADCGTLLADSGICPKCYDGAEDLDESTLNNSFTVSEYSDIIKDKGGVVRVESTTGEIIYLVISDLGLSNYKEVDYSTAKQIISDLNLVYDSRRSNNLFHFFTTKKKLSENWADETLMELHCKPKSEWTEEDWNTYNYCININAERDYYDSLDDLYESDFSQKAFSRTNWVGMTNSVPVSNSVTKLNSNQSNSTSNIVTIVYDNKAHKLRARADDGINGPANVAFPNNLRTVIGQQYKVDKLIWNGKNYRVSGNITPV